MGNPGDERPVVIEAGPGARQHQFAPVDRDLFDRVDVDQDREAEPPQAGHVGHQRLVQGRPGRARQLEEGTRIDGQAHEVEASRRDLAQHGVRQGVVRPGEGRVGVMDPIARPEITPVQGLVYPHAAMERRGLGGTAPGRRPRPGEANRRDDRQDRGEVPWLRPGAAHEAAAGGRDEHLILGPALRWSVGRWHRSARPGESVLALALRRLLHPALWGTTISG